MSGIIAREVYIQMGQSSEMKSYVSSYPPVPRKEKKGFQVQPNDYSKGRKKRGKNEFTIEVRNGSSRGSSSLGIVYLSSSQPPHFNRMVCYSII